MKTICYFDASNVKHSADKNFKIDYEKLAYFLSETCGVDEIHYFGALFLGKYFQEHNFVENDYINLDNLNLYLRDELRAALDTKERNDLIKTKKELAMVRKLQYLGYLTYIKPLKIIYGKRKADCDVNIAVETEKNFNNIDKLVLVSGDGDLLALLRHAASLKKEVLLVSFGDNTAKELKKIVKGNWINMSTLKNKLERK